MCLNKTVYTFFYMTSIEAYSYRTLNKIWIKKKYLSTITEFIDLNEKQFNNTNHTNKYLVTVDWLMWKKTALKSNEMPNGSEPFYGYLFIISYIVRVCIFHTSLFNIITETQSVRLDSDLSVDTKTEGTLYDNSWWFTCG